MVSGIAALGAVDKVVETHTSFRVENDVGGESKTFIEKIA